MSAGSDTPAAAATKTFRFEGYSDDTFGEYNVTNDDFDNCASGEPIEFTITDGDEGLVVVGQYAPGGCGGWLIGVAPLDEDYVPDWAVEIRPQGDSPYTPSLLVTVPMRAVLTCATRGDDTASL